MANIIRPLASLSTWITQKVNHATLACVLCGRPSAPFRLCRDCCPELPRNTPACARCAEPLPTAAGLCGRCLNRPPALAAVHAPLRYAFPCDRLISGFKYQGRKDQGLALAEAWLREPPLRDQAPVLVPIPLHWRRYLARGFNQSAVIADFIGRHLDLRVDYRLCRRARPTPSQTGLSREERRANLRGVFRLKGTPPPFVALVDDVVTTASTGNALAEELLRAGARRVELWALARTPSQA